MHKRESVGGERYILQTYGDGPLEVANAMSKISYIYINIYVYAFNFQIVCLISL